MARDTVRAMLTFIGVIAQVIILQHVEVIDGTGVPARADQSITIDAGKITAIGPTAQISGATVLDLTGYAVMPGIVGMHDHFWYQDFAAPETPVAQTMSYSA